MIGAHTVYYNSYSCHKCKFSGLQNRIHHLVTGAYTLYNKSASCMYVSKQISFYRTKSLIVSYYSSTSSDRCTQSVFQFIILWQVHTECIMYSSASCDRCTQSVLQFSILWQVYTQCFTVQHLVTGVHTVYYSSASCDRCTHNVLQFNVHIFLVTGAWWMRCGQKERKSRVESSRLKQG